MKTPQLVYKSIQPSFLPKCHLWIPPHLWESDGPDPGHHIEVCQYLLSWPDFVVNMDPGRIGSSDAGKMGE